MPVTVNRRAPRSEPVDVPKLKRAAERMLADLELSSAELSVLLTDDPTIRELNGKHRKKDKATDVLSFPMEEPGAFQAQPLPVRLLGDVAISIDTAVRQAKRRRRPLMDELLHLLAHGLLHLVGYDHETDADELRMDARARRLLAAANRREYG